MFCISPPHPKHKSPYRYPLLIKVIAKIIRSVYQARGGLFFVFMTYLVDKTYSLTIQSPHSQNRLFDAFLLLIVCFSPFLKEPPFPLFNYSILVLKSLHKIECVFDFILSHTPSFPVHRDHLLHRIPPAESCTHIFPVLSQKPHFLA